MVAIAHIVPADQLPRCSRHAAMIRDVGHNGHTRGNGVLTRAELEAYIEGQIDKRQQLVAAHEPTRTVDRRLMDSNEMLADMKDAGVDGLSYLPKDVEALKLQPELQIRVVEMLVTDDEDGALRVTQPLIDRARARYMNMDVPSLAAVNSRDRALGDFNEIARSLGLF